VVPARDLKRLDPTFCQALRTKPQPWQTVAMYVNYFTGSERVYRRIGGRNVRVYPIPARE
jgi:hypothetical protein